jgi:CheY-like chemotaxis protein
MTVNNQCFSRNVFLADDDEDDCLFFSQALNEVCHEAVLTASHNGQELMHLLNRPPEPLPDVIFLDLNMPVKNGYECLKEIRSDKSLKNFPVIIFTTSSLQEDIDRVYNLGATFFISKPSNYTELKNVIRKAMSINWTEEDIHPKKEKFVLSA